MSNETVFLIYHNNATETITLQVLSAKVAIIAKLIKKTIGLLAHSTNVAIVAITKTITLLVHCAKVAIIAKIIRKTITL